jgi:hypothetical protein
MTKSNEELEQAVSDVESGKISAEEATKIGNEVEAEFVQAENLETNVEKGLAKAFPDPDSTPQEETKATDETEETEESTSQEEATEETEETDESTSTEEKPEAAESDEEPDKDKSTPQDTAADTGEVKIPEAYIRAAIHQKWSAEDIKELQKSNPDLALRTFKKMYEDTNKLSQEYAAIGRKRAEEAKKQPEKKTEEKVEASAVDLTKLKQEYGDDPIVGVVETLAKQNAALLAKLEQVVPGNKPSTKSEAEIRAEIRENQAIEGQINTFFGDKSMAIYSDFYGEVPKGADWSKLTGEQQSNRMTVLNLADQICIGAQAQGKDMTVDEAMEKAHLIASSRFMETAVREDIKKKAVKFSKAKTLHPHATQTVDSDKPKTEEELNAKVALGLKKVFGH